MNHLRNLVLALPFLISCHSSEDDVGNGEFGTGCAEEFGDSPSIIVAACPGQQASWQDFDESCVIPKAFELSVSDSSGQIVVSQSLKDPVERFKFGLPDRPGTYRVVFEAPGYEPLEKDVCLTAYDGCHVTEHYCDQDVDLGDFDSHWKPFLLIDLTPDPGSLTGQDD